MPRARLAALALTLCLPGLAHAGVLLTSDTTWKRVRFVDSDAGAIVYDLTVAGPWASTACDGHPLFCYPMGFHHVVHGDRDYLDLAVGWFNVNGSTGAESFPSSIARFALTTPTTEVFTLKTLDFRQVPGYERLCPQGVDEPHGDPSVPGCSLQFLHSFQTVADDPAAQTVTFFIADPSHARVLGVDLDYSGGNQTGVVRWALDATTPGWPAKGFPNGITVVDEPGGPYLMMTYYDDGVSGHGGMLILFKPSGEGWAKAWQFPDPTKGDRPYVQAPHMGQLITDPMTGERLIFYAHGRGMASDWDTDPDEDRGGSVGVLIPGDPITSPPTYLGDGALGYRSEGERFLYTRDVELSEDGSMWITDAACETLCPEPGILWEIEPFYDDLSSTSKLGPFSSDNAQQRVVEVGGTPVRGLDCGLGVLFQTDYLEDDELGSDLRRAARVPGRRCTIVDGQVTARTPAR